MSAFVSDLNSVRHPEAMCVKQGSNDLLNRLQARAVSCRRWRTLLADMAGGYPSFCLAEVVQTSQETPKMSCVRIITLISLLAFLCDYRLFKLECIRCSHLVYGIVFKV